MEYFQHKLRLPLHKILVCKPLFMKTLVFNCKLLDINLQLNHSHVPYLHYDDPRHSQK
jgi:hypothetical protein